MGDTDGVDRAEDDGLAEALGSSIVARHAVGWGDARATDRVQLADGRVVAARRIAGLAGVAEAERVASLMRELRARGLPVPDASVVGAGSDAYLVTPWIDGETGAAWLDGPIRAVRLAEMMGALLGRIRTVDGVVADRETRAADSRGLAEEASSHLDRTRTDLLPLTVSVIEAAVEWLAATDRWAPVLVHGDYAPINVIVAPDGAVQALLDLEHARMGSPVADAAWWGWVVRHHHPDAWEASWAAFRAAAGVTSDDDTDRQLRAVSLARLLESVACADDAAGRRRWAARLDEAAAWT